jgi:para-aminobenzoate synthetase/4-amino-4-deoxychorismate lyase
MENYSKQLIVRLAKKPVNSNDVFLFHKTTHRTVYDQARAECSNCDEVLLYNEKREITEFTNANILVKINGQLFTPPVECGLLAGTFRQYLLDQNRITEKVITLDKLAQSDEILLINSVRKFHSIKMLM